MSLFTFLLVTVGWVFSLCLHEYAHARTAYAGGDVTVRDKGYLSFNPLRYADPVYSILMPMLFLVLGGIGLPGGAVYIETWRLRSARWRTAVSLAGPAANLALVPVLALLLRVVPADFGPGLAFLAYLQVMAVLFNLLPIPPLDGYGALRPHLSPERAAQMDRAGRWAIWVLFAVLWFVDPVANAFWGLVSGIASFLGIPLDLASEGYRLMMALTRL
jgi:Zn-dependent protease